MSGRMFAAAAFASAAAALSGATSAQAFSFTQGDLVVSVEGNGSNTGNYTDNQAAPLTLYEYSLNGTHSATKVGSLELPQTSSGSNFAISGEYGSSSEGTLQLSGDGRYLTIMGYGVNANAFNANPGAYSANSSNTALGQSGSLQGKSYTAVPRVVALIGANGSVDTSTALYGVFDGNNPRSAYTADGTSFYVSGQGTKGDATGGVFYATKGSHTATSITGADAGGGSSQDTRFVTAYNNTLYVSSDSKTGNTNRDYIGTLGTTGTLPTSTANGGNGPAQLSGFGSSDGKGKITVTANTANGINTIGSTVNLSPENFFFANATTLYVTDSGSPKNGSTLGDGGLQKWSLTNGTWTLDYTLSKGLNLAKNSAASGTTGLYALTAETVTIGGLTEEELFVTTYAIGDTDPTYLYGITDLLDATTLPGDESFTLLATAPTDTTFKGVSFAPSDRSDVPEPAALALLTGLIPLALRRRKAA